MGPTRSLSCSNLTPRAWKNKENVHNFTTRMYKIITMILIQCFKTFIKARYQGNWPIVWMILPAWFDHLKDSFPYKEVPHKTFCLGVKTSCPLVITKLQSNNNKNINKLKVSTRVPLTGLVIIITCICYLMMYFNSFLTQKKDAKGYPEHTSIPDDKIRALHFTYWYIM